MLRPISFSARLQRVGRWCCGAAAIACLSLSGCRTLDYSDFDLSRVEGFADAPASNWPGQLRPPDNRSQPFALTNEGMEIEGSFGIRRVPNRPGL